jgi:hypothetical protein
MVESLKRILAVPGDANFVATFPNTSDDDLTGVLGDAFSEAQLDGFFGTQSYDPDTGYVTVGLSNPGMALVVLYASIRVIRTQLRNLQTSVKYKAGPVEYDVQQSANVLSGELKAFEDRQKQLIAVALRIARATQAVSVTDSYLIRAFGYFPYSYYGEFGGFYGYELAGLSGGYGGGFYGGF